MATKTVSEVRQDLDCLAGVLDAIQATRESGEVSGPVADVERSILASELGKIERESAMYWSGLGGSWDGVSWREKCPDVETPYKTFGVRVGRLDGE